MKVAIVRGGFEGIRSQMKLWDLPIEIERIERRIETLKKEIATNERLLERTKEQAVIAHMNADEFLIK